tara:strand:- start:170 stop:706 length:537 start_codon:yes stop_codon:yes gene_type:complete
MGAVITDGDIAFLVSEYPDMGITVPTAQQETLLLNYLRGQAIAGAAASAGYKSVQRARDFVRSDRAQTILSYLREREFSDVRIDRDSLTSMFLEAYHGAATAMEKIAATRELGKLHAIYPDAKKAAAEAETLTNLAELSAKKLQSLSNDRLLELSGRSLDALDNDTVLEGEVVPNGTV